MLRIASTSALMQQHECRFRQAQDIIQLAASQQANVAGDGNPMELKAQARIGM